MGDKEESPGSEQSGESPSPCWKAMSEATEQTLREKTKMEKLIKL